MCIWYSTAADNFFVIGVYTICGVMIVSLLTAVGFILAGSIAMYRYDKKRAAK